MKVLARGVASSEALLLRCCVRRNSNEAKAAPPPFFFLDEHLPAVRLKKPAGDALSDTCAVHRSVTDPAPPRANALGCPG